MSIGLRINSRFLETADSRPKLVSGSADGYSGHVDGKLREARMNHPKGITVDDRGNIYIADTENMAIRKISDTGKLLDFYLRALRNTRGFIDPYTQILKLKLVMIIV